MPRALHNRLARQARKKGYTGERADAYVYGTMAKQQKRNRLAKR